jgi:uncharacterized repeat protein (TIGR01451 family)
MIASRIGAVLSLVLPTLIAVHAAPPTITKSFSPTTIPVASTPSTLVFTITNPNDGTTMTNIGFTDILPAGLVAPASSVAVCGGTLTVTLQEPVTPASTSTITLSGASIANPGPPCQFAVAVIGLTAGTKLNTTSPVTSSEGNGNTATATLEVVGPPVLAKAFSPAQILVNQNSALTFTIKNPNTSLTLTGIGFTDTLPVNVVVATPNGLTGSCGGGVISAAAGGGTISLAGATLAGQATCTFSVNVTSSIPSLYPNITSQVSSAEQGLGAPVVATLTVVGPPTITKSFSQALIPLNQVATISLTITNPNPTVALTGVGFTDALPNGLISPASVSISVCGGTLNVTQTSVALVAASLPPGSVCPLALAVIGTIPGSVTNTTSPITSNEAGSGKSASASAIVVAPPVISKTFGSLLVIPLGATAPLTFTVENPNVPVALTGVGFTDNLPPGLVVATPPVITGSCGGGTITAVAGTGLISLAAATLAPTSSCTFSVSVLAVGAGLQVNTTSQVNSVEGGAGNTGSAAITTGDPYQVRYSGNLNAGDSVVNLTNAGTADGNICANVYVFSPDEQMVACCSCLVTPNGLKSLSVRNDLVNNTLTPASPSSVIIRLLTSQPVGGGCNPTSPTPINLLSGISAWGTTLHALPTIPVTYGVTETGFSPTALTTAELSRLTAFCGFIQGNGSGYGICKSCRAGGLGAERQ